MSKSIENRAVSRNRDSLKTLSRAWTYFSKKLALALSKLKEDQYLIINAKRCDRYVQFACDGEKGMRVEVSSNHFLKGKDRLNRRQTSWLRENGWNAPTGKVNKATPEKEPNGSPNYFVGLPVSVPAGDIAHLATEALVHGLEIPGPTSLSYQTFPARGTTVEFEDLSQFEGEEPRPREMFDDPEPHDEDDPAYREEIFETMKAIGCVPESLTDSEEAEEYRLWLEKNP
ncbi:hypothetical protein P8935_01525 [Telmatobacter sp. DSM 110680]|uniref:TY-Chap N-terminal domain-containing protein n=1 Tax=Telmatobacter sp. DSM 110680 TaxID=3036704 RepID=A0AAU7DJU8_9BACT